VLLVQVQAARNPHEELAMVLSDKAKAGIATNVCSIGKGPVTKLAAVYVQYHLILCCAAVCFQPLQ
jgi:hypothetical protein